MTHQQPGWNPNPYGAAPPPDPAAAPNPYGAPQQPGAYAAAPPGQQPPVAQPQYGAPAPPQPAQSYPQQQAWAPQQPAAPDPYQQQAAPDPYQQAGYQAAPQTAAPSPYTAPPAQPYAQPYAPVADPNAGAYGYTPTPPPQDPYAAQAAHYGGQMVQSADAALSNWGTTAGQNQETAAEGDPLGLKRPLGRTVLLSIISFGLYGLVWFYINRRQIDQQLGEGRDDAMLHTVGLVIPIVNIFVLYVFWRDVDIVLRRRGMEGYSPLLYTLLAVFIPFGGAVICCLVLNRLNEYWDVATVGQAKIAAVSKPEKIAVAIGACLFALWLLLFLLTTVAAGGC